MVTIDVPACMTLGAAVALRQPALPASEQRLRALALVTFGFSPFAMMFLFYFSDWQWQYFGGAEGVPPFALILFIVAMAAGGLVGVEWARRFIVAGNRRAALAVAIVPQILSGLYSAIFWKRVFWVGSYSEWASGGATFMLSHHSFMLLLIVAGVFLTAVNLLFMRAHK
jgi:hypothetical protein